MRTFALCCALVLSAIAPSLAAASDDYGHDDSNRSLSAAQGVAIADGAAGPKTAQTDDAPYPDVARDPGDRSGVAFASAGGPEAYGHDDASYGPASEAREMPANREGDAGSMAAVIDDHSSVGSSGGPVLR